MRKINMLLSMLVLVAVVLTACGGGATSTNVVESPPPVTIDATEDMSGTATQSPTDAETTSETPGVPVTGDVNPARLSNQLDFTVWSQDGEQIGDVEDMVLDFDNREVAYVVVGTGGFLELGEREILVPWDSLQLQTGTGDTTGGQQNAFILQTDLDTFSNAPDFDLTVNLPQMGQPAADWDMDVRNHWQGGGAGTGDTANTPAAGETVAPDMTATGTGPGTDATQATATMDPAGGTAIATATTGTDQEIDGTGTATVQGQALQGVMLASEVLNSTVILGGGTGQGTSEGASQAIATGESGQGTGVATATGEAGQATAVSGATAEVTATAGTDGTGQGDMTITIEDLIVGINEAGESGNILYLVVTSTFAEGERWIPVPMSVFQWDGGKNGFILNADAAMIQNAPSFQNSRYPDTTATGWNAEFDTFWQSNGPGSGTGLGADATATP